MGRQSSCGNADYMIIYKRAINSFLEAIPDSYDNKVALTSVSTKILDSLGYKAPEIINDVYRELIFKFTPFLPEPTEDSWGINAWKHLIDGYEEAHDF